MQQILAAYQLQYIADLVIAQMEYAGGFIESDHGVCLLFILVAIFLVYQIPLK